MLRLSRTVRFSVNPGASTPGAAIPGAGASHGPVRNGYAAWPAMRGLGRHYELDVVCRGEADPQTGYFVNIKEIDQAARRAALPLIERACAESPATEPGALMPGIVRALGSELVGRLERVRWRLSPTYSVEMESDDMTSVTLRQRFEFAAAHRLHVPAMSDEENRACFGKCNNPSGHGHNYRVEPAVRVPLRDGAPAFGLDDLERLTDEAIIERFDHTHLNTDTREFAVDGGLNPSVEHIAKVCFDLLAPRVKEAGAELASVTVWETEKTSCTYPG